MTLYSGPINIDKEVYLSFSNARLGKSSDGHMGYLSGIPPPFGGKHVQHDWLEQQPAQRRIFISADAELLAAASPVNRARLMAKCISCMISEADVLPFFLFVHSGGLHSTFTTLDESNDYRLWPRVAITRNSYEKMKTRIVQCRSGKKKLAGALTNGDIEML